MKYLRSSSKSFPDTYTFLATILSFGGLLVIANLPFLLLKKHVTFSWQVISSAYLSSFSFLLQFYYFEQPLLFFRRLSFSHRHFSMLKLIITIYFIALGFYAWHSLNLSHNFSIQIYIPDNRANDSLFCSYQGK